MTALALIESVGRGAPGGLDAILGVVLGALVVAVLWWHGATARVRSD